jgi:hypothetical protein
LADSPAQADQHRQPLYRSRWLRLDEIRAKLMASGVAVEEAERQITDMIRDGVLPGGAGDGLRIRIAGNDNPWFARSGTWLRDRPALDLESSTIRAPARCETPARSITQDTFAMLRTGPRTEWTLEWLPIEILREDFERLLRAADPTDSPPESPNEMPGKSPDAADDAAFKAAVSNELNRSGMTTGYRRIYRTLGKSFGKTRAACQDVVVSIRGPQRLGRPPKKSQDKAR